MIDIHSHLLYGIDDGSSTIEDSIAMIKKASKMGYTDMILTPHFIEGTSYNCNNRSKKIRLSILQKKINELSIPINLYVGNEIQIHENMLENFKNNKILSLNDSNYMLIELPFNQRIFGIEDLIFDLTRHGITPIIAHIERYHYITEDDILKYLHLGCLFQGNLLSLKGKYGKNSEKRLKNYLKKRIIYFLSTDAHNIEDFKALKGIEKKVKKIVKNDILIRDLMTNNARKVIENKNITRYKVKEGKLFKH